MAIAEGPRKTLEKLALRHAALSEEISAPDAPQRPDYPARLKELGQLDRAKSLFDRAVALEGRRAQADDLGSDPEMADLASEESAACDKEEASLQDEVVGLLVDEQTGGSRNVILEVRAGTGGDEAGLFAADLFRMYGAYAESRKWKTEILASHGTDLGGFREIIGSIQGPGAYGRLRFESGGHRVQRVPVTESSGRIHTSAATVAVLPEVEEVEVQIAKEDLRIDVMRASGPGGQSVNKTSSAVRMTHIPTGLVVSCQDEKSQHKNKARALRILRSRLYDLEAGKRDAERAEERRSQIGSGDRSARIRTYNYPQSRVTDHRIGFTSHDLDGVLSGALDPLLDALTEWDRQERLAAL